MAYVLIDLDRERGWSPGTAGGLPPQALAELVAHWRIRHAPGG